MASGSQRASTPNTEGKKRKSDDKVDVTTLGQNQIIPLIMGGVKMPEGIPNKDLKGLLDSNPSIKVIPKIKLLCFGESAKTSFLLTSLLG